MHKELFRDIINVIDAQKFVCMKEFVYFIINETLIIYMM